MFSRWIHKKHKPIGFISLSVCRACQSPGETVSETGKNERKNTELIDALGADDQRHPASN